MTDLALKLRNTFKDTLLRDTAELLRVPITDFEQQEGESFMGYLERLIEVDFDYCADGEGCNQSVYDNAYRDIYGAWPRHYSGHSDNENRELPQWRVRINRTELTDQFTVVTVRAESAEQAEEMAQVNYSSGDYDEEEFEHVSSEYSVTGYNVL